jgi:hypothetical protein
MLDFVRSHVANVSYSAPLQCQSTDDRFAEIGGHREQSSKLWSRRRELVASTLFRELRFVTT